MSEIKFYKNKFPKAGELVVVNVTQVKDTGVYVSLLEYGGVEGMIVINEISRRRIKNINRLFSVNKQEVVLVIRVDEDKGYIDLSKVRVTPEDIEKAIEKYKNSKIVYSTIKSVAKIINKEEYFETLYESIALPLYEKYNHAIECFNIAITDPNSAFDGINISYAIKSTLVEIIKKKMIPASFKFRADFDITCFNMEGVIAIKKALKEGVTDKVSIKLLDPSSLYVAYCVCTNKEEGYKLIESSLMKIKKSILSSGGTFELKSKIKIISEEEKPVLTKETNESENSDNSDSNETE